MHANLGGKMTARIKVRYKANSGAVFLRRFKRRGGVRAVAGESSPVQGPSWGDGLRQVIHQGRPASSVNRHGQGLRLIGLQHVRQPTGVGRDRVV